LSCTRCLRDADSVSNACKRRSGIVVMEPERPVFQRSSPRLANITTQPQTSRDVFPPPLGPRYDNGDCRERSASPSPRCIMTFTGNRNACSTMGCLILGLILAMAGCGAAAPAAGGPTVATAVPPLPPAMTPATPDVVAEAATVPERLPAESQPAEVVAPSDLGTNSPPVASEAVQPSAATTAQPASEPSETGGSAVA